MLVGSEVPNLIPNPDNLEQARPVRVRNTPVLALTYNDKTSLFHKETKRLWNSEVEQTCFLKSKFPKPPLIAIKRNRNVREMISVAKTPYPPREYLEDGFSLRQHIAVPRDYLQTLGNP